MIDRTIAPDFNEVTAFQLIEPQRETWPNGMDVFVFNGGKQDLVRLEWVFGNRYLTGKSPIVNLALAGLLLDGTQQLSSAEIAQRVDFYGAFLRPEFSFDHTSLVLHTLNKHLPQILPVVRAILQEATFPEKELQTYIRNNKHSLGISLRKHDFVARRAFNNAVFGATPYGYSPEVPDYDSLDAVDLRKLYAQQLQPSNCTLFIAGKVGAGELKLIRQTFEGAWHEDRALGDEVHGFTQQDLPADRADSIYIEKEGAVQSAIRLGSLSIKRSHPDFPAIQLLNTILGGYFGSRLMANIREDKGYTYGIGSGIGSLRHGAFFTIATEVGVDLVQKTLEEIEKEINKLRQEPVSQEELSLVKNYINGTILGSLENIFSHADKFKQVYFQGLDNSYYDYNMQVLHNSTPLDVLETANKYLHYDKMVKVVVGKW